MNIEDYDKKIVFAFGCGSGGLYVKENYDDAVRSNKTLMDIVKEIVEGINYDIKYEPDEVEEHHYEMLSRVVNGDDDCIKFINDFMVNKMSQPERCGEVAGILFRDGKLQDALDFLEVSDMEEDRYWDS